MHRSTVFAFEVTRQGMRPSVILCPNLYPRNLLATFLRLIFKLHVKRLSALAPSWESAPGRVHPWVWLWLASCCLSWGKRGQLLSVCPLCSVRRMMHLCKVADSVRLHLHLCVRLESPIFPGIWGPKVRTSFPSWWPPRPLCWVRLCKHTRAPTRGFVPKGFQSRLFPS